MKTGCWGCAWAAAAMMGLVVLLVIAASTGSGFVIGALVACIPAPFYIALALWLDRFEPEPPRYLIAAFLWGAIVAVFFALFLNTFNTIVFAVLFQNAALAQVAGSVISAPLVEESSKAFFLLLMFFFARHEFDGIVDGVIYATMVALGFAMTENIMYYGHAGRDLAVVAVLRGVLSPYSHPLFTSMTGMGLGWARQSDHPAVKVLAPLLGFAGAISLHALWNLSATLGGSLWLLAYIFIMLPAGLVLLAVVGGSLMRESRILAAHLEDVVSPQELKKLQSIPSRIGGGFSAFFRGGPAAWMRYERYTSATSELAFLRQRRRRKLVTPEQAAQQEQQLLQQISAASTTPC